MEIKEAITMLEGFSKAHELIGDMLNLGDDYTHEVSKLAQLQDELNGLKQNLEIARVEALEKGSLTPADPENPDGPNVLDGKNEGERKRNEAIWLLNTVQNPKYIKLMTLVQNAERDVMTSEAVIDAMRMSARMFEAIAPMLTASMR